MQLPIYEFTRLSLFIAADAYHTAQNMSSSTTGAAGPHLSFDHLEWVLDKAAMK